MNVKEYISSGIIESYVLGIATTAERQEFELLCETYPELVEARNQFELALESQLMQNASAPPAYIKDKIEQSFRSSSIKEYSDDESKDSQPPVKRMAIWPWLAAACFLLMAGSLYWAYSINIKYKDLERSNIALNQQLETATGELSAMKKDEERLHSPDIKMAAMHSTGNPGMYATIYWDTTSKDVYLMVNNLPQTPSDKQYQLWALLNNKPIDLGVIPHQERLLLKMKNVQNAQAFAVTLEPKGGSPTPTSNPIVLSKL